MVVSAEKPLSKMQKEFMQAFVYYGDEIADNGNIMAETGWDRRQVQSVGRGLVKRGILQYTATQDLGFEGGIWSRPKKKKAKKTKGKDSI
jgi:hypothetical protein